MIAGNRLLIFDILQGILWRVSGLKVGYVFPREGFWVGIVPTVTDLREEYFLWHRKLVMWCVGVSCHFSCGHVIIEVLSEWAAPCQKRFYDLCCCHILWRLYGWLPDLSSFWKRSQYIFKYFGWCSFDLLWVTFQGHTFISVTIKVPLWL